MQNPTFHPFPALPLELRLKIWSHLLPEPRIVDIIAVSSDEGRQLYPLLRDTHAERRWVRSFVDEVQSPRQTPLALMFVNREARGLVLKKWRRMEGVEVLEREEMVPVSYETGEEGYRRGEWVSWREGWRYRGPEAKNGQELESIFYLSPPSASIRAYPVLFNPEHDVLFLADPANTRRVSGLAVLVRWLDQDLVQNVKNLAVPYYSWRKDRTFGNLGELRRFRKLERLWICFVGDEGREAGGWLGAVRRRDGGERGREEEEGDKYLIEVREQVRGDVALEAALKGWERPVVRVVRDRGFVIKELREGRVEWERRESMSVFLFVSVCGLLREL
jgi:hypothetical protein